MKIVFRKHLPFHIDNQDTNIKDYVQKNISDELESIKKNRTKMFLFFILNSIKVYEDKNK